MKTRLLFIVLFVFIFTGCSEKDPSALPMQTSEGVVFHGSREERNSWVENTNDFPVRIIFVHRNHWGIEAIISINTLKPGTKLEPPKSCYTGLYIYTIDGVLIGWISCL